MSKARKRHDDGGDRIGALIHWRAAHQKLMDARLLLMQEPDDGPEADEMRSRIDAYASLLLSNADDLMHDLLMEKGMLPAKPTR